MPRNYVARGPKVVEPDKVYGRKAAAAFAGVTENTITLWERGWGQTQAERDANRLLEWGVDYGDYELEEKLGRDGKPLPPPNQPRKWYSKRILSTLGLRARENAVLRSHGHARLMGMCFDEEHDRRNEVLDDLIGAPDPLLQPGAVNKRRPTRDSEPALLVVEPGFEDQDDDPARLRARLEREAAERARAKLDAERAQALGELAALPEEAQALARALILGEPTSEGNPPKRLPRKHHPAAEARRARRRTGHPEPDALAS